MITLLVRPELYDRDRIEVEGPAYRHLFRARRLRLGVRLRVVDGCGRARWGEVDRIERRRATLALADPAPTHEPTYRLHLAVAAPRPERAAWLVEKATELGVRTIVFFAAERTPRKYGAASLERLRRMAAAAVEQCHRSRVPEISGVEAWSAVIASLADGSGSAPTPLPGDRFYLDTGPRAGLAWGAREPSGLMWVGPEGGWSEDETAQLDRLGCRPVSLGSRTLRVETAAVAAAVRLLLDPLSESARSDSLC